MPVGSEHLAHVGSEPEISSRKGGKRHGRLKERVLEHVGRKTDRIPRVRRTGVARLDTRLSDNKVTEFTPPGEYPDKQESEAIRGKIRPGVTLKDLIKERGYTGKTLGETKDGNLNPLALSLIREWHASVAEEVGKELGSLPEEIDLSQLATTDVPLGEAQVRILGIFHGHARSMEELRRLNSPYADHVRGLVRNMVTDGYSLLNEQGLDRNFGIEGLTTGLSDHDEFKRNNPKDRGIYYMDSDMCHRSFLPTYNRLAAQESRELQTELGMSPNSTRTSKREVRYQRICTIATPPEPLAMELAMVMADPTGWDNDENIVVHRSMIMAREIRKKIASGVKKVGFFCGDAHRRQVEYLLLHPEYDPRKSLKSARKTLKGKK